MGTAWERGYAQYILVFSAERSGWGSLGVTQSAQILGRNRQRIEAKSENSAAIEGIFILKISFLFGRH